MSAESKCGFSEHRRRKYIGFFFQAEDGIRHLTVTGVQTCALPISSDLAAARAPATANLVFELGGECVEEARFREGDQLDSVLASANGDGVPNAERQIGRASCRERV